MKRRLLKLTLLLLLGAAINVAVAWGLGLWHPFDLKESASPVQSLDWYQEWWNGRAPAGVKALPQFMWEATGSGTHLFRIGVIGDPTQFIESYVIRTGLPFLSMEGSTWLVLRDENRGQPTELDHRSLIFISRHQLIPLRPLWPRFTINTLFYAAVCWLVFVAPFALRCRLRQRRGLCPACAYPIATSEVCTECGQRIRK